MGQRTRILTEILGVRGWKIVEAFFESPAGERLDHLVDLELLSEVAVVLRLERRWAPRCSACGAICRGGSHEHLETRRWKDLPWAGRSVWIEAAPDRVKCKRCGGHVVERLAWADPYQRETVRLQQLMTFQAASEPTAHVAVQHGVDWGTVRRAEAASLARWDATREATLVRLVGVDEKWLGRRHKLDHHFVTIVSNLETGEPVWMGPGRGQETLASWMATLSPEEKERIELFAMDMHGPFAAAVRADPVLKEKPIVHDPFHVMKRAQAALDEIRREVFFRAGPELRGIGRGTRWLVLRAWERCTPEQQAKVTELMRCNPLLGRAYQIKEELRGVLHAPDRAAMEIGLARILRRTQARRHVELRKLHDSLLAHREALLGLAEHRPPTGRIEALNNNWETLVRRARGYRNYQYLLLKLRFMTANPIADDNGARRFLALGLQRPTRRAA
ncbi:MAG: ISL3 family transposase [Planctomycetota bacterium]